ncbi:hypothetical protein DFA_00154 [Cavenderia fasciculata]|uniref:Uncharacterized protein n=1 Tax=Cavenderia fasciculata TaxID=261658 RepID=F4PXR6_CACFS|nr:uncharacterized protein DFA_00154 [Cavenderia fasciculata]EGG19576.1 hypothetical protein DFA_00154 [Cavenderia fasciculata]|eukprot:XP_004357870.1 hypothetical protein DFA_00154 [Cavenderia fasciculata]
MDRSIIDGFGNLYNNGNIKETILPSPRDEGTTTTSNTTTTTTTRRYQLHQQPLQQQQKMYKNIKGETNQHLQEKLDLLKFEHNQQLELLQDQIYRLEKTITRQKGALREQREENKEKESRIQELEKENDVLKDINEELEGELQDIQENGIFDKENADLKTQLKSIATMAMKNLSVDDVKEIQDLAFPSGTMQPIGHPQNKKNKCSICFTNVTDISFQRIDDDNQVKHFHKAIQHSLNQHDKVKDGVELSFKSVGID